MMKFVRIPLLTLAAAAFVAAAFVAPAPADAQIRASEPTLNRQTIDGTVFTIEYYRPRARGREPLFGVGAVVWEEVWTPGANWATSIEFQKPVKLDGVALEAGKYAVWMEMSEKEFLPHELVLEPYVRRFHTQPPQRADNQIRMPITLTEGPHKEMLTWEFEEVRSTGGTLSLRWGTTRMAFDVRVESSMRQTVTEEEAAPVIGAYGVRLIAPNGQEAPEGTIELRVLDNQTLHADLDGIVTGDPTMDGFFANLDMMLLPVLDGVFAPGEVYDGELREVWEKTFMEFTVVDGLATSFEIRDEQDVVFMKGTRKN